jgi:hypothetical protein
MTFEHASLSRSGPVSFLESFRIFQSPIRRSNEDQTCAQGERRLQDNFNDPENRNRTLSWMAGERIQKEIFAAQATQPASETSRLDRRSCVSKVRGQLKIKFKPVKTGPLLLPIG